jgi:hypothetical protein
MANNAGCIFATGLDLQDDHLPYLPDRQKYRIGLRVEGAGAPQRYTALLGGPLAWRLDSLVPVEDPPPGQPEHRRAAERRMGYSLRANHQKLQQNQQLCCPRRRAREAGGGEPGGHDAVAKAVIPGLRGRATMTRQIP